ncbi:MAG: glycoside hydrolase family 3 domain protein [Gemmatimonadetes bacterium]|nr:glycoside hydrolase family 3 domain protein [Gemmatimonadota bacterium]
MGGGGRGARVRNRWNGAGAGFLTARRAAPSPPETRRRLTLAPAQVYVGPPFPPPTPVSMPRKFSAICLLLCACSGPGARPLPEPATLPPGPVSPPSAQPPAPAEARWVQHTLASLSLRQKVAQMMMPWTPGDDVAEGTEPFERVSTWVSADEVGGIIVSTGTPTGYAAKLNALQRRARVPLLVATDLESGPGMRLVSDASLPAAMREEGGTSFPPVMGLAAAGSDTLAFQVGRVIGSEGRAVGLGLTLSPVLDVNSNPSNPIINVRSFGERADDVGRLAAAYVRGVHAGGLLSTGKHFPGHGDTRTDSHIDLPTISADSARLDSVELRPFRAAIAAGLDAVLVGHISVPAMEADGVPASMSRRFSTDVLRGQLGFRGLVFTDAMNMGGLTRRYSEAEAAVRAVEAGADILLQPPHPRAAIDAVVAAVQAGRLTEARIDASVRRILEAKQRVGLSRGARVDAKALPALVGGAEHRALAREVADRSVTLVRDDRSLVPLPAAALRVLSVTYADAGSRAPGGAFDAALAAGGRTVDAARVDARTTAAEYAALGTRAAAADVVLVSAYVTPREYRGSVDADGGFTDFVEGLSRAGKPVVAVSFGSPYLIAAFPSVPGYLLAWGSCAVCQQAAARALLGRIAIGGKLPVSLPPRWPVGWGIARPAPGAVTQ